MRRCILLTAALAVLAGTPAARAAELCADPGRAECFESAAQAFAAAAATEAADRIVLGAFEEEGVFGDAGRPLTVLGTATTLRAPTGSTEPVLALEHPESLAQALSLAGDVTAERTARLEGVAIDGALEVRCTPGHDARVAGRHLIVTGVATVACRQPGAGAALGLADSVLVGTPVEDGGVLTTRYSAYPAGAPHAPGTGDVVGADPGLAADGLRPAAGSPLIEAGDPQPLGPEELLADADGRPRMADANGDGAARRDIGAFEHHPPPPPPAAANLLANGGAEDGTAGWQAAGMSALAYGFEFFPGVAAGEALGGGLRFFAGDEVAAGALRQEVDLRNWAPEIDAGTASVTLSLLAGGYRADADTGSAEVRFSGPGGDPVGGVVAPPGVSAADRGHAITLLRRGATGAVPVLARSATVTLSAARAGAAGYADAYFDDVALTLDAPPLPGQPPPPPPPPPGDPALEPFAGATVLTRSLRASRAGRVRVRLGCADATVGRCAGTLTLVAVLRSDTLAQRIGSAGFALLPGQLRTVRMRLTPAARRVLRRKRRKRLRATLYASARDGQGLAVSKASPVVVTKPSPPRKRRRR